MISFFCAWQFQNDSKHILVHTEGYVSTNQHSEQQSESRQMKVLKIYRSEAELMCHKSVKILHNKHPKTGCWDKSSHEKRGTSCG